jgi:hypothetical protein
LEDEEAATAVADFTAATIADAPFDTAAAVSAAASDAAATAAACESPPAAAAATAAAAAAAAPFDPPAAVWEDRSSSATFCATVLVWPNLAPAPGSFEAAGENSTAAAAADVAAFMCAPFPKEEAAASALWLNSNFVPPSPLEGVPVGEATFALFPEGFPPTDARELSDPMAIAGAVFAAATSALAAVPALLS